MAKKTTLSEEEQAEIFHAQGLKLAGEMAAEWEKSLGPTVAPAAYIGAIEAFITALARLGGVEPVTEFLDRTAAGLREAAQKLEAESKSQASVLDDVGSRRV